MTLTPSEMALRYAGLGWFVIPVTGKRPTLDAWQTKATNDQAATARLFAKTDHDGVGVLIGERSGLIDFDCDNDEAEKTLLNLFDGSIPQTPCYQSTRGKHYLFKWTDKLPQGSIKLVVDGLEIRLGNGEKGCQTVFPPSGNRSWIVWPDDCELAELPDSVIRRINDRYAELSAPKRIKPQSGFSVDSSGSGDVLNVPRWLAKHGREIIGRTDGSDGTTRWHIECPGVDLHTTQNSWRDCCVSQDLSGKLGGCCFHASCGMREWQALRDAIGPLEWSDYHDEQPPADDVDLGGFMVEPSAEVIPDEDEESPTELVESAFPAECLRPVGLIGDFIDYTLETAKYPQPIHTLAAGLAFMSVLTARRVRDSWNTRTNLMIVSLGPTRSGKEYPRKVIKNALGAVGAASLFEEKIASNAALHGFLNVNRAGILINDEFGDWLALARSKGGANTQPAQIISSMLKLYSSADCVYKADRYADNSKQIEINQPHLTFLGTSTGEVFWKHVTPEYLSGGLFGRVMLMENNGYVLPRSLRSGFRDLPTEFLDEVRAWLSMSCGPANLNSENPTPIIVPHDTAAMDRYEAHEMAIAIKRQNEDAIRAALWSGTAEITAKLALLFACSRSRNPLLITIQDVDQAVRLSNWLTRRKLLLCDDHVAENAVEDAVKRVLRIIKNFGKRGISRNDFTRKVFWLERRHRENIIADLIGIGRVRCVTEPTATKPKEVYIAV